MSSLQELITPILRPGGVRSSVYVLRLVQDKWYVGTTNDIDKRWSQHQQGAGSLWTRKYQPLSLYSVYSGDKSEEIQATLKYMYRYGVPNVRGGPWAKPHLSKPVLANLENVMKFLDDACYRCGQKGHYANTCKNI